VVVEEVEGHALIACTRADMSAHGVCCLARCTWEGDDAQRYADDAPPAEQQVPPFFFFRVRVSLRVQG
jgi:hypothetical protein